MTKIIVCRNCKQEKNVEEFYSGKRNKYWCKECLKEYMKMYERKRRIEDLEFITRSKVAQFIYNRKPEVAEKHREYASLYNLKNKDKIHAQSLAHGIKIEGGCIVCNSEVNLVRHHPDYSKPMEVVILCRSCHRFLHSKVPNKININYYSLIQSIK